MVGELKKKNYNKENKFLTHPYQCFELNKNQREITSRKEKHKGNKNQLLIKKIEKKRIFCGHFTHEKGSF